jgi:5-formyltetrahydrofolate cyclo-ligase
LFPEIPTAAHDIFMDKIVTELTVYEGKGRGKE